MGSFSLCPFLVPRLPGLGADQAHQNLRVNNKIAVRHERIPEFFNLPTTATMQFVLDCACAGGEQTKE